MTTREKRDVIARLRLALEMQQDGVEMKRLSLRRAHPRADPAEIDRRLMAWLLDRPLDSPGKVVSWPRAKRRG